MKICKQIFGLGLLLLLAQNPVLQAQDEELLPPEEAFGLSAWVEGRRADCRVSDRAGLLHVP